MQATLAGTILVVEDTPSEMELMVHYLRDSGCTVTNKEFQKGVTGLENPVSVAQGKGG